MVRDALSDIIKLENSRPIKIIKYPHDIEASWSEVRAIIPQLLSNKRKVYQPDYQDADAELNIDILIQLGMRRSEDCIVFETVARRDGYVQRDVDDKELPPGDTEPGGIWEGLPEKLATSFDIDSAAQKVTKSHPVRFPYELVLPILNLSRIFPLEFPKMHIRSSVSSSFIPRSLSCTRSSFLHGLRLYIHHRVRQRWT